MLSFRHLSTQLLQLKGYKSLPSDIRYIYNASLAYLPSASVLNCRKAVANVTRFSHRNRERMASTSSAWKKAIPASVRGVSPTRGAERSASTLPYSTKKDIPNGPYCDPVDHAGQHKLGRRGSSSGTSSTPADGGALERHNGKSNVSKREPEEHPPLIISLVLDDGTQEFISKLRARYFPKARNHLQGHITLFHALPSKAPHLSNIKKHLEQLCDSTHAFKVGLRPPSLSKNSKAVFVPLSARPLYDVHSTLLDAFKRDLKLDLTDQDANPKFWPHATVINKVEEKEALDAYESLQEEKQVEQQPAGKAIGLDLWFYRGGPWEHLRRFDFAA